MSAGLLAQRLAVFVGFAALAAAAGIPVFGRSTAPGPEKDATALKTPLAAAARLHPVFAPPPPAGPAPWCGQCHAGLPHPGKGIAAAMLNEHAGRMDCLLCHWPAAGGQRPGPAWKVQAGGSLFLTVLAGERSSKEDLVALRTAATVGRPCFGRGPACASCHRPGLMGPLLQPDATPGRAAALERLENYFTLAPGEKWYFPNIR